MAKRAPAPAPAAAYDASADAAAADAAAAEALAAALAAALPEEDVALEDLVGTPEFLEELEALPPLLRAKRGFTFSVLVADRGPHAYLADSDWGSTVPTPKALAERYGVGNYRVRVKCRRKGKGGGFGSEISVRIAPDRDPANPPASSSSSSDRTMDLLERLLMGREAAVAAQLESAADASRVPDEPPAWAAQLIAAAQSKQTDDLPPWAAALIEKGIAAFLAPAPTKAAAAAAAE